MKLRIGQNWRWLVALCSVFVPAMVSAALKLPFTFKSGDAIKASEVNANFAELAAKIDVASGSAPSPIVGAFTLAGVVSDAPIRKFTQSVDAAWSPGSTLGRPQASPIVIERDVGEGSPLLNHNLCLGKTLASASIVLGDLTIDLTQVLVSGSTLSTPSAGVAQEAITLSYGSVTYTLRVPNEAERSVTYDIAKAVGGSAVTQDFVFGQFPAGVAAADTFTPITGAEHHIGCVGVGCKPQHGALSVTKRFEVGSMDALGLVFSGKVGSSVDVEFFSDAATVNEGVQLDGVVVTGVALSTDASGNLDEKVSFGYQTITWTAGNVSQGWDVVANKAL